MKTKATCILIYRVILARSAHVYMILCVGFNNIFFVTIVLPNN
jgi:hypothetical protein